jgi:uncharacterized membrane protein
MVLSEPGISERPQPEEVLPMKELQFPAPFSHDHPSLQSPYETYEKGTSIGEKAAETVATTVGSWRFIMVQSAIIVVWCILNAAAWTEHWDPYPFIFLNLVFSIASAYTAPLIMMSQNRQDEIDRIEARSDYILNQKVEQEIHVVMDHLDAQNEALRSIYEELGSITELMRSQGRLAHASRPDKSFHGDDGPT